MIESLFTAVLKSSVYTFYDIKILFISCQLALENRPPQETARFQEVLWLIFEQAGYTNNKENMGGKKAF